jgi:hypothetical protein
MRWLKPDNRNNSDYREEDGFSLALGSNEARRQAWAGAAVCAAILVAVLAALISGTP